MLPLSGVIIIGLGITPDFHCLMLIITLGITPDFPLLNVAVISLGITPDFLKIRKTKEKN